MKPTTEETDMTHQTTIPWARRLGALAVMIALMAVLMTVGVQADGPDWKQPANRTDRNGRGPSRRDRHRLGPPPPDHQDAVRLPRHLDPGRRELQEQRPDRMVRLPHHQPDDGSGTGRGRSLPSQGPRPVRRQPKVGLDPGRDRTGWNRSPSSPGWRQGPG